MSAGQGRPCPNDCGRAVREGQLLCGPCWREVPPALQRDVWRTWNAYRKDMSDERWFAYVDAREAALHALGERAR